MDFLVYPVHLLTAHPFAYLAVALLLTLALAVFSKGPNNKFKRLLYVVLFLSIPVDLIWGSYINNRLVYLAGEPGVATVTGRYNTNTEYNNFIVVGYHVLIRTKAATTIQTSFEDDAFNVYPSHNRVSYPQEGDRFNVRFLKHFPGCFIIIANDDSPWARGLQCSGSKTQLDEARSKFEFDKGNKQFKAGYINAIKVYINERCYTDTLDLEKYYGDIQEAEKERP